MLFQSGEEQDLRQFIEAEPSQDLSHQRHPRIVPDLEQANTGFVQRFHLRLLLVGKLVHCTQLVHPERFAVRAYSFLHVDRTPRTGSAHEHGEKNKERPEKQERQARERNESRQ